GNGGMGYGGDGGLATNASFNFPVAVTTDAAGNLFISDTAVYGGFEWTSRVRRVDATSGIITRVAGSDTCCSLGDGGPATSGDSLRRGWESLHRRLQRPRRPSRRRFYEDHHDGRWIGDTGRLRGRRSSRRCVHVGAERSGGRWLGQPVHRRELPQPNSTSG